MSKRNLKSKMLQEERQEIGAIYKQYIETFQESAEIPRKVFVKSETLYSGSVHSTEEKGLLYTPVPRIKCKQDVFSSQSSPQTNISKRGKRQSNLKSLGDELKMLQNKRQTHEIKNLPKIVDVLPSAVIGASDLTNSTNLFISNLKPQITENSLIKMFGKYGALASVKIMWPRKEFEKSGTNCGFVAFMSRADAERALEGLRTQGEIKIGWGKSVKLPPHPMYIPPALYNLFVPPPPSGLPFNAQMPPNCEEISDAVIKVTIPFDRNVLMIIHRVIEFVVREGFEFEEIIKDIEINNSSYQFLFDYKSPTHIYYRWKLYSILNGDSKTSWSMKPFKMYETGSIWIPPIALDYANGMPKHLIARSNEDTNQLSEENFKLLLNLIKKLTATKTSISSAMYFCIKHRKYLNEICDILVDSFTNSATTPFKKIARLYLISDILYNSKKFLHMTGFQPVKYESLLEVFEQLHITYKKLKYQEDKMCYKMKVLTVLKAWFKHNFFNVSFITKLENVFLSGNESGEDDNSSNDEPLDGANLVKRSLQTVSPDCLIVKKQSKNPFDIFNAYK